MRLFGLQNIALVFLVLVMAGPAFAQSGAQKLPESALIIETDGKALHFTVELAETREQRAIGLMFRPELAEDKGMIFSYSQPRILSIWMKNTFIPLDIIFIRTGGRIANITQNAVPHSLDGMPSAGEAISVLELAGGVTEKLGIKPGDLVRHRIFGNLDENEK